MVIRINEDVEYGDIIQGKKITYYETGGNYYFTTYKIYADDEYVGNLEDHWRDVSDEYYVAWISKGKAWETKSFDTDEEAIKWMLDSQTTNESLKRRTNEKLYVDSFDDAKCIGYGFLIRNMNTAYLNLYWYRSEDLAKQNLTIAELMSDEDNYDYDSFEDDMDTIVNTADGAVEEIDWRHDIDYFNKDGREICAYNTYTFDDDEYVELIDGENWVDLYF